MINRRRAMQLALTTALLPAPVLLAGSHAHAQPFQSFFPLLVDLQGWTGNKPDGAVVEIPGNSMVTATREYRRGPARISAQVIMGAAAKVAVAAASTGLKIETTETRMSSSTVGGLQVMRSYNIPQKNGGIVVILGPSAVFTVTFNGIDDDEAMTLARRFDWKGIQAAISN